MIFFLLVGAILGALSVIFVLQNIVPITVIFLSWQIEGSLAVVLFLAMMSGVLVALLLILPGLIRDEFRYSKLRQEKKEVEDELTTTRKVINEVAANSAAATPRSSSAPQATLRLIYRATPGYDNSYYYFMDALINLLQMFMSFLLGLLTLFINFWIAVLQLVLSFAQSIVSSVR